MITITKTTINIGESLSVMLKNDADRNKISISQLVSKVLHKIVTNEIVLINIDNAVKYQMKNKNEKWLKQHVSFSTQDYEVAIDLRKFTKKSVSSIISYGIKRYLNEIIGEMQVKSNGDNYPIDGYFFSGSVSKGRNKFKIFWGLPRNLPNGDNYPRNTLHESELGELLP